MSITIAELLVADPPEAWRAAGFAVDRTGHCTIGTVRVRLLGDAGVTGVTGVTGWTFRGLTDDVASVDGIPTGRSELLPGRPGEHPNGARVIDHVVVITPDLGRTRAALDALGLAPRRERDGELGGSAVRQVFYRLGEVILEVVGDPHAAGAGPARLWGLTHAVADIDACAHLLGDHVGRVKDAVQPGRRITTLRGRDLGVSVATAFIS